MQTCNSCNGPLGNATWTVHGEVGTYCSEPCFYRARPDVARKYGIIPQTVDELIEWLATPATVKSQEAPPLVMYRCDQDKYDIYYAPAREEATYVFDHNGEKLDLTGITGPQVVYLVQSGYWRELLKDEKHN